MKLLKRLNLSSQWTIYKKRLRLLKVAQNVVATLANMKNSSNAMTTFIIYAISQYTFQIYAQCFVSYIKFENIITNYLKRLIFSGDVFNLSFLECENYDDSSDKSNDIFIDMDNCEQPSYNLKYIEKLIDTFNSDLQKRFLLKKCHSCHKLILDSYTTSLPKKIFLWWRFAPLLTTKRWVFICY